MEKAEEGKKEEKLKESMHQKSPKPKGLRHMVKLSSS